MIRYDVRPLIGIGPVLLGMSRAESRRAMGQEQPKPSGKNSESSQKDAYHESAFQVHFDAKDQVEYIELGPSPLFGALYKGVDVHRTKAIDIVARFSKDAPFDAEDPELGYSYIFRALELSVWRPVIPEDEGDPTGQFFESVGVGRKGYYTTG